MNGGTGGEEENESNGKYVAEGDQSGKGEGWAAGSATIDGKDVQFWSWRQIAGWDEDLVKELGSYCFR
jgi:hypothetical protein